jgi:hypothetical protein
MIALVCNFPYALIRVMAHMPLIYFRIRRRVLLSCFGKLISIRVMTITGGCQILASIPQAHILVVGLRGRTMPVGIPRLAFSGIHGVYHWTIAGHRIPV